jgi:hypothetical protein
MSEHNTGDEYLDRILERSDAKEEEEKLLPGMVRCEVTEDRIGNITVTIPGHKGELFMQSDWDQASFACNCGLIETSDPLLLADVDLEDITQCPDDYIVVISTGEKE